MSSIQLNSSIHPTKEQLCWMNYEKVNTFSHMMKIYQDLPSTQWLKVSYTWTKPQPPLE